jgi:Arc/MetJ-type ribon-helix-helix transcriptional regulator
MPRTRNEKDTEQISVTLPVRVLEIMERLRGVGLYGTTRGEVARALIQARIEDLMEKGVVKRPEV